MPPQFDGHPHQWFTPSGQTGSHYVSDTYLYPNAQSAAPLWYHDHAFGITRLNVYAGLAALYLIRDTVDTGVVGLGLNIPKGVYEIPLVIQDRMFNPDGTLFYPTVGVTAVHPIWVPEFFGDTPVVNAKAYPYLNVARRRYRFRVYNGSQARFYNLWFDNGTAPVPFYVIGMEGGFLPAPVLRNKLLLAPGERADIIFDFGGMPVGTVLTLKNNAKAPYPGGKAGGVPQIMQFRVTMGPPAGGDPTTPPAQLVLPPITPLNPGGAPMREVVLQENVDPITGNPIEALLNGKYFNAPVEETPKVGDTEVWQFINITGDAHPMHTHLVMFQVLNRQPLNAKAYDAAWRAYLAGGSKPILANYLVGPPVPPPPEESGWKDTAKAYPGEVLQVVAKFDLPPGVTAPADYVYHCHILEHEENEMMRPYQVI
ncbi:MAG: multicopper oxidase domain-containing protein [Actinomycetota bacterium]